ncbi:hypothetical protein F5I97DRAFT_129441 [Phlebopus sp. FC_14]|nr:hypothetical protein F5I97DRAFT_129441 [Phlebopus sp. FC_14]
MDVKGIWTLDIFPNLWSSHYLTLVVRAYALFNKSRWIALFICTLTGSELTSSYQHCAYGICDTVRCIPTYLPRSMFYMCAVGTNSFLIYHNTYFDQNRHSGVANHFLAFKLSRLFSVLCNGWERTPLVPLLVREGVMTYLNACAVRDCSERESARRRSWNLFTPMGFCYLANC